MPGLTAAFTRSIGGNSGIQYRSKVIDEAEFIVGGYQADIDASLTYAGINYEERGRGIISKRGTRSTVSAVDGKTKISEEQIAKDEDLKKVIKNEDWNHYKVVAKGNKLSHYINDTLMSETIDLPTPSLRRPTNQRRPFRDAGACGYGLSYYFL